MTCTHATLVAAVKALLNGRGVFGEQTSPVPPELGLISGVIVTMACLHRVKHGKPPTELSSRVRYKVIRLGAPYTLIRLM